MKKKKKIWSKQDFIFQISCNCT